MTFEQSSFCNTSMKWRQMHVSQRIAFVFKNVLNLAAFGFLFPHPWD